MTYRDQFAGELPDEHREELLNLAAQESARVFDTLAANLSDRFPIPGRPVITSIGPNLQLALLLGWNDANGWTGRLAARYDEIEAEREAQTAIDLEADAKRPEQIETLPLPDLVSASSLAAFKVTLDQFEPGDARRYNPDGLLRKMREASEGHRNETLNALAYMLVLDYTSGQAKIDQVRSALDALAQAALAVGLGATEIQRTLKSAWDSGTRSQGKP